MASGLQADDYHFFSCFFRQRIQKDIEVVKRNDCVGFPMDYKEGLFCGPTRDPLFWFGSEGGDKGVRERIGENPCDGIRF